MYAVIAFVERGLLNGMLKIDPFRSCTVKALALVLLVFSRPWPCVAAQASDSAGVPLGVVRVVQARLPIPVDNARRSFKVGDRAQLFQENEEFFIALVDKPFDSKLLVAVPLRKGGGKTAWVTPENVMFFGTEVAAVEGRLYLRADEELSVIREEAGRYEVVVERLGQQAAVWISKADPGVRFTPNPTLSEAGAQVRDIAAVPRLEPVAASRPIENEKKTRAAVRRALRHEAAVVPEGPKKVEHLFPEMDEQLISFMLPTVPGLDWDSVEPDRIEPVLTERLEEMMADVLYAIKQRLQLFAIVLLALVLLIALFVFGLRRAVLKHAHEPSRRKLVMLQEPKEEPAAAPKEEPEKQGLGADFSGSVASMSLGAVTQFLNSDKETGVLTISEDDHKRMGTMVFMGGEIIDAQTSKKRGAPAVYELLKCKKGLFAFVRQPKVDAKRTVDQGTIALLLDAHRELDETHGGEEEAQAASAATQKPAKKEKASSGGLRIKRRADH